MPKTAIFFSPEGGSVHQVAGKLGAVIGEENVEISPVSKVDKGDLEKYSQIILVGSTVGADHWSNEMAVDEWQEFFTRTAEVDLSGKNAAIIGLGNSVLYPEHFADGMATLHKELTARKATVLGFVSTEGYTFEDSEALDDEGMFCGLPLDEDNEEDLTQERLEKWLASLEPNFQF